MDDIEIKTPSGYTAFIHPFLTYDQFVDINKMWTRDMKIEPDKVDEKGKPVKPKMGPVDMNLVHEANKLATKYLVIKITDPSGKLVERKPDELPVPIKDAMPIVNEIARIQKEASDAFQGEKK